MRLLLRYLRPQAGAALVALSCAALNQVLLLLDPIILRRIIDIYGLNPRFAGRTVPKESRAPSAGGNRGLLSGVGYKELESTDM